MMYWVTLSENELVDLVVFNIVDSLNSMANELESTVRTHVWPTDFKLVYEHTYGQRTSD